VAAAVDYWYHALGYANLRTLMYYAQHRRRGFVLTPDQVSKFYRPDPSMEAKGGIQRRPLEKSVGVINSKDTNNPQLSRAQLREIRFPRVLVV